MPHITCIMGKTRVMEEGKHREGNRLGRVLFITDTEVLKNLIAGQLYHWVAEDYQFNDQ